ncbi:MAG: hypothetical protein PUE17_08005 [Bacteroidales bacterium]|nr:hypothetical protein [Bacteroidales bacterium]
MERKKHFRETNFGGRTVSAGYGLPLGDNVVRHFNPQRSFAAFRPGYRPA